MKNIFLIILFVSQTSWAQQNDSLKIDFLAVWGDEEITENKEIGSNKIQFSSIRFYISNIQLIDSKGNPNKVKGCFLVDIFDNKSIQLPIDSKGDFKGIRFDLGIDSATNSSGVFGGDLDPTNGMYWTWQSGYINMKIEGTADNCGGRNKEFHFHLGGYLSPYQSVQTINLKYFSNKIKLDLSNFMTGIDLEKEFNVMSPGAKAVDLSKKAALSFENMKK